MIARTAGLALTLVCLASPSPMRASGIPLGEELLRAIKLEHEAGRFDGVALIGRGDKVEGEFAFGLANRAFGAAHRVDEPFPVASVTKQFLAVMIMQLGDAGKLGLDDTLASRFPPVASKAWAGKVTLRHLLSHTSGLPQPDATIPDFYTRSDIAADSSSMAKLLAAGEPSGGPGLAFSYNNSDYVYLAAVIEAARGVPCLRRSGGRSWPPWA